MMTGEQRDGRMHSRRILPDRLYRYRSMSGDAFRHTQAILTRNELFCSRLAAFNDPFEGYFALTMPPRAPAAQRQYETWASEVANRKVQASAAVCSFSEKKDDLLMWGHYADSHRGICIEFAPRESKWFADHVHRVRYLRNFKEVEHGATKDDQALTELVCTAKAKHWQYEAEWRIVIDTAGANRIPAKCVTGVIFGCRIAEDDERWIRQWVQLRKPRPALFRAVQVQREFRIQIIDAGNATDDT